MAKFYVFRGKRALWNLFIIVLVVFALVYIFRVEGDLGLDKEVSPKAAPEVSRAANAEPDRGANQVILIEPVTVRTVPTKFSEYKLERERMRSRQMELLQNLAYDTHTASEPKGQAQKELQALVDKISRETEIESLLKATGYLDGLVILDQESITVVVPVTLTREEASRIGELVHRLTGIKLERITIVDETIHV